MQSSVIVARDSVIVDSYQLHHQGSPHPPFLKAMFYLFCFKVYIEFVTILFVFCFWFLADRHVGSYLPDQGNISTIGPSGESLKSFFFFFWKKK